MAPAASNLSSNFSAPANLSVAGSRVLVFARPENVPLGHPNRLNCVGIDISLVENAQDKIGRFVRTVHVTTQIYWLARFHTRITYLIIRINNNILVFVAGLLLAAASPLFLFLFF